MGCGALITVTELSRNYASVWNRTFPFISKLVRKANLQIETFDEHIVSKVDPSRRALINEIAFRMFEKSQELKVNQIDESLIEALVVQACKYIAGLEKAGSVSPPDNNEKNEAVLICKRTKQFFEEHEPHAGLIVSPRFTGCGVISTCFGDVLTANTLYEIKAGEREFRVYDIKQLLAYSTLNYSEHNESIKYIALLNPRLGNYVKLNLKESVEISSGKAAADAFLELINFFDNPDDFR